MSAPFDDLKRVLSKDPDERRLAELEPLEDWFRKKAKVFDRLPRETLFKLLKECQFRRVEENAIITQHGDSNNGSGFFIVLRGRVSVQLMPSVDLEDADDVTNGAALDESNARIGTVINTLGEGDTFGELNLIADECVQNAAYVAEEDTDLILLSGNHYKDWLSDFIDPDLQDRLAFVDNYPLFSTWPNKWKKYLAASLSQKQHGFEEVLVKQGERADHMYFIISGELSVVVDPAAHEEQFAEFRAKHAHLLDDANASYRKSKYFTLTNWLSAKSRVSVRLKSARSSGNDVTNRSFDEDSPEVNRSPSAIRRHTARSRRQTRRINLCYLSKGNIIGDVEFILDMEVYHVTATCTQQTVTMSLHRAVYDRIFRKKNPDTYSQMCRNLDRQIPARYTRRQVLECVPLIPYVIAKIQAVNGTAKANRDPEDVESLPLLDSVSQAGSRSSRTKSVISARSFPLTRRNEVRLQMAAPQLPPPPPPVLPSVGDPSVSSGYAGSVRSTAAASRRSGELPETADGAAPDPDGAASGSRSPRQGIFIKLLQIANPMVSRRHLNVDEEEYRYLLQLRRRMARKIEDFYPMAAIGETRLPSAGGRARGRPSTRATTARLGTLPTVPGAGRASPQKTAMKRRSAKARPNTRQKSVFFSLP